MKFKILKIEKEKHIAADTPLNFWPYIQSLDKMESVASLITINNIFTIKKNED